MTRIERLITWRMATRIMMVIIVFMGLIALTESLDGWRYQYLSENQGPEFALLAILGAAARWSLKVLPVTVLIGAIIGLLDMQSHRELLVIKAGGISIWRIVRGPVLFMTIVSVLISLFVDGWVTEINRGIIPVPRITATTVGDPNQIWLEQDSDSGNFVIHATRNSRDAFSLSDATFFFAAGKQVSRIVAKKATLGFGSWILQDATLISSYEFAREVTEITVETNSTRADLELRLKTSDDFTFFELQRVLAAGLSDPVAESAAKMRFAKLLALPALLVGSLLIAFAFTAGYRRTGSYGGTIIYGIVLGFVVFVTTEMAERAGAAGVLDPTFAAWGPAIVSIVIGVSVLLHKEDGRA